VISFGSVLYLCKIGRIWRGKANRGMLRVLTLVWLALSIALSFTVAGIFVGQGAVPAHKPTQIIARPTNCGPESTRAAVNGKDLYGRARKACRRHATSSSVREPVLQRHQHDTRLWELASSGTVCPFANRCGLVQDNAVQLQTGTLHPDVHLGVSAALSNCVGFRISTTCSII
ncbi:hypothetical protein LTR78_010931, partial [Recurvomyces mirabilis]